MQARVVRIVVVKVRLVRNAAGLPDAVEDGRVHAEVPLRLTVRIGEAILDDASDHRHVLVDIHFTIHDRRLNQDGLPIRGGDTETIKLIDGALHHPCDNGRRSVVLRDLVGTGQKPTLGVSTGLRRQADRLRVGESSVHLFLGDTHDVNDPLLDLGHLLTRRDRNRRINAVRLVQQSCERTGCTHLLLQAIRTGTNGHRCRRLLKLTHEGSDGLHDARIHERLADIATRRILRDRHLDRAGARPGEIIRCSRRRVEELIVGDVAGTGQQPEHQNDNKEGPHPTTALALARRSPFTGEAARTHARGLRRRFCSLRCTALTQRPTGDARSRARIRHLVERGKGALTLNRLSDGLHDLVTRGTVTHVSSLSGRHGHVLRCMLLV